MPVTRWSENAFHQGADYIDLLHMPHGLHGDDVRVSNAVSRERRSTMEPCQKRQIRCLQVSIRLGVGFLWKQDVHQGSRANVRGQETELRHLRGGSHVLPLQQVLRMLPKNIRVF